MLPPCPRCNSVGKIECLACNVKVKLQQLLWVGFGASDFPECKGFGEIICHYCGGLGYLWQ